MFALIITSAMFLSISSLAFTSVTYAATAGTYTSKTWEDIGDSNLNWINGQALPCTTYLAKALNTWYGLSVKCAEGGYVSSKKSFLDSYAERICTGNSNNPNTGQLKAGDILVFNQGYNLDGTWMHVAILGGDGKLHHGGIGSSGTVQHSMTVYSFLHQTSSGKESHSYIAYRLLADKGYLTLTKSCVESQADYVKISPNNYSLAGAQYGVYTDKVCTNLVGTLTTDSNGRTNTLTLKPSTYYIKELVASKGYKIDSDIHSATVSGGRTTNFAATEIPGNDPVRIVKINKDTPDSLEGLEGAEFTYTYYDLVGGTIEDCEATESKYSWTFATKIVDEQAQILFSDDYYIGGDELIYNTTGKACIPLGTFTIKETKAPKGFKIDEKVYVGHIWIENDTVQYELEGGDYLLCEEETVPAKVIVQDNLTYKNWKDGKVVDPVDAVDTGDHNDLAFYVTLSGLCLMGVLIILAKKLIRRREKKDNA